MRRRFSSIKKNDKKFFTIESLVDYFTVSFSNRISYSINNGPWIILESDIASPIINKNDIISFKSVDPVPNTGEGIGTFNIRQKCNIMGDITSLIFLINYIIKRCKYILYRRYVIVVR